jgi:hypothetical protein
MVFSMGCRVIKFKGTLSRQERGVWASEISSRSGQVGYGDGLKGQCHEMVIF